MRPVGVLLGGTERTGKHMDGISVDRMAGVELGVQMKKTRAEGLAGSHDQKDSAREAQFGDVWKDIQSKYGAKPAKPREIKKTLGKDDFMRIMVTQMQHQDPSQPFKAEQFAQEMAQYASVEQLQNINTSVGKLMNQNQPLERLAMTNMIGKTIVVDRDRFPHAEGNRESVNFAIPRDAKNVKVSLLSDSGEIVAERELGELKAGESSFDWDGMKMNTLPAKAGTYTLKVEATDQRGGTIETNSQGTANVVGVSFEGNEPILLVGNPMKPDKVAMKNVIRIQEGLIASNQPNAPAMSPPSPAAMAPAPPVDQSSLITFKKGVGSATVDASGLDPRVRAALELAQNAEKGFPSGLTEEGGEKE